MLYVDTNVVCNYLVNLDEQLHRRAMKALTNGQSYLISDVTLFEIVYVLNIRFKIDRDEICFTLLDLLRQPFIKSENLTAQMSALLLWSDESLNYADFADCLLVERARSKGAEAVVSFDRHFDCLPFPNLKP